MTIKKSETLKSLEKLMGGPLTFQDLLHATRMSEELSQTQLGQKVGVSRSKICDFEKGRRKPTLILAAKMAKALRSSEALFVSKLIEDQLRESKLKLKVKIEAA